MDSENKETNKEADIMSTAIKLREDELVFAKEMRDYVVSLEENYKQSPDKARKAAKEALKRTGVTSSNGSTKKKIVSWE